MTVALKQNIYYKITYYKSKHLKKQHQNQSQERNRQLASAGSIGRNLNRRHTGGKRGANGRGGRRLGCDHRGGSMSGSLGSVVNATIVGHVHSHRRVGHKMSHGLDGRLER